MPKDKISGSNVSQPKRGGESSALLSVTAKIGETVFVEHDSWAGSNRDERFGRIVDHAA